MIKKILITGFAIVILLIIVFFLLIPSYKMETSRYIEEIRIPQGDFQYGRITAPLQMYDAQGKLISDFTKDKFLLVVVHRLKPKHKISKAYFKLGYKEITTGTHKTVDCFASGWTYHSDGEPRYWNLGDNITTRLSGKDCKYVYLVFNVPGTLKGLSLQYKGKDLGVVKPE